MSLDIENVAGEADQDWGGSGGAARVVSDHFGTNRTTEIGNGDVRMKKVKGIT